MGCTDELPSIQTCDSSGSNANRLNGRAAIVGDRSTIGSRFVDRQLGCGIGSKPLVGYDLSAPHRTTIRAGGEAFLGPSDRGKPATQRVGDRVVGLFEHEQHSRIARPTVSVDGNPIVGGGDSRLLEQCFHPRALRREKFVRLVMFHAAMFGRGDTTGPGSKAPKSQDRIPDQLPVQMWVERSENIGVELGGRPLDDWSKFAADHAPDALIVVNDDGRLAWGSPAATMILGHDPEAALGINVFDLVHPDDLGYAAGALHETARKDGFHLPVQIRVQHAAGHWVDVEITANTVIEPGESHRIVLSLRPLDARLLLPQRRRAFEELLDRVSRRCAGATWQAVAGIVTDSLGQVGEFFNASRVIFALQDHTAHRLRVQAEWSASDALPASHNSTNAGSVVVVDTDDPSSPRRPPFRYTEDVTSVPGDHNALLAHLGVHSELVVPVAPDDVLLAALAVHWPESGDAHWDDALGTHANALAQVLAATVQRSQSEAVVHHR